MTRFLKAASATTFTIALLFILAAAMPAFSAPVLANGDFEAVPTPNLGNNFGVSYAAPWQVVSGNSNVIKVDGAGPYIYAPNFPANDVDASNPGAVSQHYFDVAGGGSEFFQVFTPLCTGEVRYGAAFSFADESVAGSGAQPGVAGITIKLASDGSVVVPRQNISIAGGNTATNPWSSFTFSANLTAGTTYSYWVDMNDWSAMDNAFVEFQSNCPEHNDDDIVDVDDTDDVGPQLCTAFEPEVTCDTATGETIVTLTNSANGFDPSQISITSQTGGVGALQSSANPLQVLLTGAQAGQNISLWVDAIEKDGGSAKGLDACCMGEISVQIPEDYVCEKPPVLEVTKTCEEIDGPVRLHRCTIDVHYSGPPPSPALTVTDTLSGTGATLTGPPGGSHNWACTGSSPATCTIDAASDPSIDWSDFNSTVMFDVSHQGEFENCAKTAGAGLEDEACWSTSEPELTVTKTADQTQCNVGEPCLFTITVTNPSTSDFNGPLTLTDAVVTGNGQGGQFSAISPALCNPTDIATTGHCTGTASIPAGASQAYSITWIPPWSNHGEDYQATNCAGVSSAGGASGYSLGDPNSGGDLHCAGVNVGEALISITKTGPATCAPNGTCTYQVTTTNNGAAYNGPLMLADNAPNGYQVTAVTGPATSNGCGAGLPAAQLACVYNASMAAGASVTHDITIAAISPSMTQSLLGQNCAGLVMLPNTAQTGDFSGQDLSSNPNMAGANLLGQSCVPVSYDPPPPPPPTGSDPTIAKTCTSAVPGPMGFASVCTITVTSTANPQPHHLTVTEVLGPSFSPSQSGLALTAFSLANGWAGSMPPPVPPATPVTFTILGAQLPASGISTIQVEVSFANEGYLVETQNCAQVQAYDVANQPIGAPSQDCANFPPPAQARIGNEPPVIIVTKDSIGPCTPDAEKKTATCGFNVTAANSGDQPYRGPMVVTDVFKGPAEVISATASVDGMECRSDTSAAHCLNGDIEVPAKGAIVIPIFVTVPMAFEPTTFENCGELGTAGDARVQAMVAQTALKALGKYEGAIDGQIGRQSRAAVSALQSDLGLEPNGQVDSDLMAALGVPSGGEPACVIVDVPVRPEPPKPQCDALTTVAEGGECLCRFKSMYQSENGASCLCVKGTTFVKGKGCIKPRRDDPPPRGPSCDPATTVLRGGKCVCSLDNYLPISPTQCAPERKVKRECPAGQVFIMGAGCVDGDIYFGGGGGGCKNLDVDICLD